MDNRQLYRALFKLMLSTQSVLAILQEEVLSEETSQNDLGQDRQGDTGKLKEEFHDYELEEDKSEKDGSEEDVQEEVTISFLSRRGEVPETSRLNMGHSEHYNNHQASILIHPSDWPFFPDPQDPFTVTTDDDQRLTMKVSGTNSRTLVTDRNYRILSEYLRGRLGVSIDKQITRGMLEKYGRTDITFRKRSGAYSLDFSV